MGGTRPTGRPADRWQKTGRRRTRPVLLAVPDLRLVSVQGSIGLAIAWDRVNDGVRTVAGGDPNVQLACVVAVRMRRSGALSVRAGRSCCAARRA